MSPDALPACPPPRPPPAVRRHQRPGQQGAAGRHPAPHRQRRVAGAQRPTPRVGAACGVTPLCVLPLSCFACCVRCPAATAADTPCRQLPVAHGPCCPPRAQPLPPCACSCCSCCCSCCDYHCCCCHRAPQLPAHPVIGEACRDLLSRILVSDPAKVSAEGHWVVSTSGPMTASRSSRGQ